MVISLFKKISITYFLLICINLNGDMVLDANDKFLSLSIAENKQPIIIFGANWCPDCRIFSGTIDIPKINEFIETYFNILYIDVKRYEINMNLIEYFDIPAEEGIPRVLVFDFNKNIINKSSTTEWRTARDRSSQDIFNFFQEMNKSG
jgi:thiol-disulfide isomerase/thioredoxin